MQIDSKVYMEMQRTWNGQSSFEKEHNWRTCTTLLNQKRKNQDCSISVLVDTEEWRDPYRIIGIQQGEDNIFFF